jgi:DNA-3-methyladenine glycosylase
MIQLRLDRSFFIRDVLEVAPELPGKFLIIRDNHNSATRHMITEVEAYRGEDDLACHARRGRTARTEIMFHMGGHLYVYLIYGMYWMLNIVTGMKNNPQAVLIRGISGLDGPGKLTRNLGIDRTFYGESLIDSDRIWIEGPGEEVKIGTAPRIGIDYAGEYWSKIEWRFFVK